MMPSGEARAPAAGSEAVVGGVIGPLDAPKVLLLGLYDQHGHLQLAGHTASYRLDLGPAGRLTARFTDGTLAALRWLTADDRKFPMSDHAPVVATFEF